MWLADSVLVWQQHTVLVWQPHSVLVWQPHNVLVWQPHSVPVWQPPWEVPVLGPGGVPMALGGLWDEFLFTFHPKLSHGDPKHTIVK